ncbi:MAG TPA: non-homologous end-joining DNA ligase [Terriglobales bacterium]|jgi:bifunctional non-homologous end joining protein LigD|nr:non-homologous end-joining DNA ligase [Terriglobales bacterium]
MSLDEYKRKRRFEATPEPPPKLETKSRHRFVVQRHDASRLHYDFRLEMEGVLKSWAVPKGPSLDPADKRLAMQVEDHPVSYYDFEGTIPEGNYGGGTVMVWDAGTWEPLSPEPVDGVYVPGTEKEAAAMLAKGDLKFRLKGKRLKGDFALVHIKARRPGSKGNEWLLIKKKDDYVVAGFDINENAYNTSILTGRTMAQIAGDAGSVEWTSSRPAARGKVKAAWLADAIARADEKRKASSSENAKGTEKKTQVSKAASGGLTAGKSKKKLSKQGTQEVQEVVDSELAEGARGAPKGANNSRNKKVSANHTSSSVKGIAGAELKSMPTVIHPMLASLADHAFDNPDWLFEIKWDGYRAIAFVAGGRVRLMSRTQNDLTAQFSELGSLPQFVRAERAILDGEIVALDDEGRPSFSLMQQRTGFQPGKRRLQRREGVPTIYYAFDLLYLDGLDLRRVALEQRKQLLLDRIMPGTVIHFSDHYAEKGLDLFEAAKKRGLEGIVAKKRNSSYEEKRSSNWLKIKITQRQECVIGGYTDPEGSREYFGALVLGLYDRQRRLIHVGQVGTGFDHKTLKEIFARLQPLKTKQNPFYGEIGGLRKVQFVRPELVAEIKFAEWTHENADGGMKLRAPVFMGFRADKPADQCRLDEAVAS